ncbi:MAG: DUF3850 domain-containing protein [Angelakisella sp.]
MIHQLKCEHGYFEDIISGKKTFEVRNNDRGFKVGDFLGINEVEKRDESETLLPSGRCVLVEVAYILDNSAYCKPGQVIMGITPCSIGTQKGRDMFIYPNDRKILVYEGRRT